MMNIKRNMFAVLAAAVLLASCSQDEVMTDTGPDGLVPVTLSAAVGDGVQTRATPDDGVAERCVIQILEKNGDEWSNAIGLGLEKNPIDVEPDVNNPAQFTLTGVLLNPDKEYTFLFWADENKGFYDASDLENVKIVNGNATNIAIAWQGKATWDKTEGSTITAELTHAVAKVTLQSTTAVESGRKFVLSNLTEYNGFDVLAGTANGDIVTSGHEGTGTGASGDLLSFYALVTDENQELKLTSGEGGVVSIPNVPLAPNTHVVLKGDVQDAGWTTVNFTASVDEIWSNDENVDILGYNYDADNNTYNVTSEEGLRAMAELVNGGENNTNINITLAKDITLTEVWTPIGSSSNPYIGTFNGNNKTITGLTLTTGDRIGLFGQVGTNGTVKDLKLADVNVSGNDNVGAVAGCNEGTISNCSVSGSIQGNQNVGGVVGVMSTNSEMIACCVTGDVKSTVASSEANVGGVVGMMTECSITACYSTGNVTAANGTNVGGVVGCSNMSTITSCYHATGDVTGTGDAIGGVLGTDNSVTSTGEFGVVYCCWSGTVSTDKGVGVTLSEIVMIVDVDKVDNIVTTWTGGAIISLNNALTRTGWRYIENTGTDKETRPLVLEKTN